MIRKTILNSLVAILAFGGGGLVFAETNVSVNAQMKTDIKTMPEGVVGGVKNLKTKVASSTAEMKARMEEKRKEVASSTKDRMEKKSEMIQNRIENRFDKMVTRLEATIVREETIMAKIVARIEKIKILGGKTADAEKLILEAKGHLTEARTALDLLKTVSANVSAQETGSTTPKVMRESMTSLKKAAMNVEMHLRLAHKALEKSIGALRGSSQLNNATSTKESESKVKNQ